MAFNFPSNPSLNDTYSFGNRTWTWNGSAWQLNSNASNSIDNVSIGSSTPSSGAFTTLSSSGDTTLGNISGNLIPSANVTYDLGSETHRWNTIYLAGNTINLGGAQIKADPGEGTIALIPQVKTGETVTKAIVIGQQGIATVDTDSNGTVSAEAIQEASLNPNTTTTNMFVNSNAYITGNITAGNILTDNYFFSNGDPFVSSNYGDSDVATYLSDIGSNAITTTGDITANSFIGDGSQLSGIDAGANVTFSDSPPISPSDGDIWIDSSLGIEFVYFNDGDSSQWVDMKSTILQGTTYGDSNVASYITTYLENISGNLIPSSNVTYNLGSETKRWNTLYLAGNTIDLGGAQIKADPDAGTIALIPQVKTGQNSTKAIVIGRRGISTVDTDNNGEVSSSDIESAATSANTSTGNLTVTGNITTGNLITDNIFFANGDPFVSGGGGGTSYDEASTSTGYFGLPVGTTEQRPGTPAYGMIRFNSNIGTVEIYNNNAWERIGGVISVTGVNPNTFSGNSGTTFTISGVGFTSGAVVSFITNSSAEYSAGTTTFINSSQLQASTPRDFTIDDEPLSVKVTNPSGITGVKTNAIDCGGSPTFTTASGTLGNIYNGSRSYTSHLNMTATDADGQGVTYSVTAGTIPAGLTFNNSSGTFSGTASSVANDTTYTFTVTASDGINETSRQFSVTVKAAITETFNSAGSVNWTSPAGVVKIDNLIMIGGGGGGNAGYQAYGWAGGGAGYVNAVDVTVESDTLYSLTVGAGGPGAIGASTTVAGENGGDTTAFNNTAFGGEGGQTGRSGLGGSYQVNNGTDNGSAAGTGGGTSGNNGKNGGTNGGGSAYGVGATATGNYTPGNSATGNGNGAGGGSSSQNWIGTQSGTGSSGLIIITY